MFINNNRAYSHMWPKEKFVKHQKSQNIMKVIFCKKIVLLVMSLLTAKFVIFRLEFTLSF